MTQKKWFIALLSAVTLAAACAVFAVVFNAASSRAAEELLEKETLRLKKDTAAFAEANENISQEISDIDTELSTKDTVNGYYMEYKKQHDSLTMEIGGLQNQIAALDSEIEEKSKETGTSASGSRTGKTYSLSANETYSCPDKIAAGRYIAKGNGTLTVTNSAGKTRVSQNLSVAYDNSYTFDLYEKEKIMVTGDIRLTELK